MTSYVWRLFLIATLMVAQGTSVPLGTMNGDICGRLEGRRYYLSEGNFATLYVKNLDISKDNNIPPHSIPAFRPILHQRNKREDSNDIIFQNKENHALDKSADLFSVSASTAAEIMYSDTSDMLRSLSDSITSLQSDMDDERGNSNESLEEGASLDEINLSKMRNPINLEVEKPLDMEEITEAPEEETLEDGALSSILSQEEFTAVITRSNDLAEGQMNLMAEPEIISAPLTKTHNIQERSKMNFWDLSYNQENGTLPKMMDDSKTSNLIGPRRMDTKDLPILDPSRQHQHRCGVAIFTCPECHLEFFVQEMSLSTCSSDSQCRCDHLRLQQPPYMSQKEKKLCSTSTSSSDPIYVTETQEANIDFFYSKPHQVAFIISVFAKKNEYVIKGNESSTNGGYIKTPFFPELYPKELKLKYDIYAPKPTDKIQILLEDFHVTPWSFLEIHDTNKSRVALFNGNIFRPPVLVSSGAHVNLEFRANGETARGFKLHYTFLSKDKFPYRPPITDCGGYVMNFGGAITMMNMVPSAVNQSLSYDCVWIIQPPRDYNIKSHISIRVDQFHAMEPGTVLEIRQGLTSDDYLLESLEWGMTEPIRGDPRRGEPRKGEDHVVSVETGFYVRLRGGFSHRSKLAIVYTSFSYLGSCYSLTDLMCHNHRCVPKMLRCDGFDHCGDNSDEPASCYGGPGGKLTPNDPSWWYQHTPNYNFPQKNPFDTGHDSGIFVFCSMIMMFIVIIGLVSYLIRQGNDHTTHRRRRDRQRPSVNDGVEIFDASADDPPGYEAPPDYEEVVKFILSGNNLKLVRRPGGVTAWVPNLPKGEQLVVPPPVGEEDSLARRSSRKIKRTRHASLDLEQGIEVVLWDPKTHTDQSSMVGVPYDQRSTTVPSPPPIPLTEFRRTSLPVTIVSEVARGHSLSVAQDRNILPGIQEGSPRSLRRLNLSEDTSIAGTSGDDEGLSPRSNASSARSSMRSNVSKRKKRGKKSKKKHPKLEGILPPSYEVAMQQKVDDCPSPRSYTSDSDTYTTQLSEDDRSASEFTPKQGPSGVKTNVNSKIETDDRQQSGSGSMHDGNQDRITRGGKYASAKSRVIAARELFKKLNQDEELERNKRCQKSSKGRSKSSDTRPVNKFSTLNLSGRDSIKSNISHGTVKSRKAMLMKKEGCACSEACVCATLAKSPRIESPVTPQYLDATRKFFEMNSSNESLDNMKDSQFSPRTMNRVKRNKSVPSLQMIRNKDLDIYFSHTDGTSPVVDEMEHPLITPPVKQKRLIIQPLSESNANNKMIDSATKSNGNKNCSKTSIASFEAAMSTASGLYQCNSNESNSEIEYSQFQNIDIPSPDKENNQLPMSIKNRDYLVKAESGAIPKKIIMKNDNRKNHKAGNNNFGHRVNEIPIVDNDVNSSFINDENKMNVSYFSDNTNNGKFTMGNNRVKNRGVDSLTPQQTQETVSDEVYSAKQTPEIPTYLEIHGHFKPSRKLESGVKREDESSADELFITPNPSPKPIKNIPIPTARNNNVLNTPIYENIEIIREQASELRKSSDNNYLTKDKTPLSLSDDASESYIPKLNLDFSNKEQINQINGKDKIHEKRFSSASIAAPSGWGEVHVDGSESVEL